MWLDQRSVGVGQGREISETRLNVAGAAEGHIIGLSVPDEIRYGEAQK